MINFEQFDWHTELRGLQLCAFARQASKLEVPSDTLCGIEDIGIVLMNQNDPRVAQA